MLISLQEIEQASERIAPYVQQTPLIRSDYFSKRLNANVFFKLEMLQPTHSFKVRGATNAILSLTDDQRQNGVITASGGNHGLGVTFAASLVDIPAYIYLPTTTPPSKVETLKQLGATTVLHGEAWDEANQLALQVAAENNIAYIHPFDNPNVMAGQATIATELLEQMPEIDMLVTSIGGGGLISGIASAIHHKSPDTRVIGVETIGADSMAQSLANGKIITLDAITSIANTLGAKSTAKRNFDIVQAYVARVVTVTDKQAVESLLDLLDHEKLLTEPATSCSVSALLNGKIDYTEGDNIVVIICGANATLQDVQKWKVQFGIS